jgi:O-antigen ligase
MTNSSVARAPRALLDGRITLPLLALWVAFSCSRWFGLSGVSGVPDLTLERLCLVSLLAYAAGTYVSGRHSPGPVLPAEIGLWAFGLASLVSGVLNAEPGTLADTINPISNALLYPAVAYAIVLRSRITRRDLVRFAAILSVFAFYLGATALLERTSFQPRLLPPSIGDPSVGIHFGRSRGPYLNAAFTGTVMVQLIPVVLLLAQLGAGIWKRPAAVLVALLCLGTYFTATRSCLLALVAAAVVGSVASGPSQRSYRLLFSVLLAGGALATVVGADPVPRLDKEAPVDTRLNLLVATGEMVLAHPLGGTGCGTFGRLNQEYYNQGTHFGALTYQDNWYQVGSHNTLTTPLAEMGLPLGLLYLVLLCRAVVLSGGSAQLGHTPADREQIQGLLTCGLVVSVVFVVSALSHELRFILAPNALLWVFAAFAERHHALGKQSAGTASTRVRSQARAWAGAGA